LTVLRVIIQEGANERSVRSTTDLQQTLSEAAAQARASDMLNIVALYAPNGDNLFLVVGGDETVVGFNYGHGDPPYYVSKGIAPNKEPSLTAFLGLAHHTEFSRRSVIPSSDGLRAAMEFLETSRRPMAITWVET
jgi:hypothetical protein